MTLGFEEGIGVLAPPKRWTHPFSTPPECFAQACFSSTLKEQAANKAPPDGRYPAVGYKLDLWRHIQAWTYSIKSFYILWTICLNFRSLSLRPLKQNLAGPNKAENRSSYKSYHPSGSASLIKVFPSPLMVHNRMSLLQQLIIYCSITMVFFSFFQFLFLIRKVNKTYTPFKLQYFKNNF